MKLAQKLILYALAVALIPLGATGFSLVRIGEEALRQRIQEHQLTAGVAVAAKVAQAVDEMARRMSVVMEHFDVLQLSERERRGILLMLYRQSFAITATAFVDRDGELLAPPVAPRADVARMQGHLTTTSEGVAEFRKNLPRLRGEQGGQTVLVSPAYYPGDDVARIAVALPCCFEGDVPTAVAGVEMALTREVVRIEGIDTGPESTIFVVDSQGKAISHPKLPAGAPMQNNGAVAAYLLARRAGTLRFRSTSGRQRTRVAAFAPVGELGWGVVVEQPESAAFASVSRMRQQTLLWVFATIAVVLLTGLLFARRLRRVLELMVEGARAFGKGELGRRIEVGSSDEIGELAETMNTMAAALAHSLQQLEEWNQTLELKVEQRTNELKETQAQLLTQSKLAAIGQLGAGVAHEVNNPLAGILGYTQLMLRKHPQGDPARPMLQKIEEAAKRCKAITLRLLRFSERGLAGRSETDVNEVCRDTLDSFRNNFEESGIAIEEQFADELPKIIANAGQVSLVLINILSNAKNAMGDRGCLSMSTAPADEGVTIAIGDTGVGIEEDHLERVFEPFFTTKKVWTGVGLGLSVAYRVVSDHGGRIEVDSTVGEGTTFTIFLPRDPPEAPPDELVRHRAVLLE